MYYRPEDYYEAVTGLEGEPEGGGRCEKCFALRLRETAKTARDRGFEYFTTTLSLSPHKNAEQLNEIGVGLSHEFGVTYLYSDFKKKNGYRRSVLLSEQYGLYRQSYCGCKFSLPPGAV